MRSRKGLGAARQRSGFVARAVQHNQDGKQIWR